MLTLFTNRSAKWMHDGRLYAVLAAAGFSLKAIFVKLGYAAAAVDPLTLLALRMGFALPLFMWLIYKSGTTSTAPLTVGEAIRIWMLAALGYYLSSLFDFHGLVYITSGLERLILYLYPTLVLLIQAWITRQRPNTRVWQSIGICYIGLAIAFAQDLSQGGNPAEVLTGSAWVFASAATYALYFVGVGAMVKTIGTMRLAGLAGSASCILVLGHFLLFGEPHKLLGLPSGVWINGLLMAVLSTTLPIYWLSLAIQRLGTSQAAAIGSLGPVFTVLIAWIVLDESLSILKMAGLALVLAGVARLKPATPAPGPIGAASDPAHSAAR